MHGHLPSPPLQRGVTFQVARSARSGSFVKREVTRFVAQKPAGAEEETTEQVWATFPSHV